MIKSFRVTVQMPKNVSIRDMQNYIRDAVGTMKGSLEPPHEENNWTGDPLLNLKWQSVKVTPIAVNWT